MTPEQMVDCLDDIGWTQRELAFRLSIHETRVRRWLNDAAPIPVDVAHWLRALAKAHHQNPAPEVIPLRQQRSA